MNERRVVHLKGSSSLGPKCGATDASIVTNWVLGATYHEVYVPADVLQRADLVCERCQDAALADDSGSDDEVVPDTEEEDSRPALAGPAGGRTRSSAPVGGGRKARRQSSVRRGPGRSRPRTPALRSAPPSMPVEGRWAPRAPSRRAPSTRSPRSSRPTPPWFRTGRSRSACRYRSSRSARRGT